MKRLIAISALLAGCSSLQQKPELVVQNPEQNFCIVKVNMEDYFGDGALKAATEAAKSFCTTGAPVLESQYDKEVLTGERRTRAGRYSVPVGTGTKNRFFKFKCSL
jgi:hypothetical protein